MAVSEKARQGIRSICFTALGWMLLWCIVFCSGCFMYNYRFMTPTGHRTDGLLSSEILAANIPLYLLGAALDIAGYLILRRLLLHKSMTAGLAHSRLVCAVTIAEQLLGIAGLLPVTIYSALIFLNWYSISPQFLGYFIVYYMIFILIWTAADLAAFFIRRRRAG